MNSNDPRYLPQQRSNSSFFKYKFLIVALVALIIGMLYWTHSRNQLLHRFDNLLKNAAQQNLIIGYDKVTASGWPWNIVLEVHNLNVKKQSLIGWQASIQGRLLLKYSFLQHAKLKFQTTDTTVVNFDLPSLPEINIAELQGDVSLHNFNKDHNLQLTNINFINAQQSVYHAAKLSIKSDDVQTEPNSDVMINGYLIEVENLTGQFIFEQIQKALLKFALKGEVAQGTPMKMVEQWYKSNGAIEIAEFRMVADKLNVLGSGTLSVDHNLQPLATLTAQVVGIEGTIDDLTARQKITPTMAQIYKLGLSVAMMANDPKQNPVVHKNSIDDGDNTTNKLMLSLTIQDGNVSYGGMNILKIPKIDWQNFKLDQIKL